MENEVKEYQLNDVYAQTIKDKLLNSVTFQLTSNCNWRCKHCFLPNHNNAEQLTIEEITSTFCELRECGVFDLILTGGEIFCRKDIMTIIAKAREMFFEVFLYTNISLLDEDTIKSLAQLHIAEISCTIFSLDEDIHDSITGVKGSLKKVLENVMLIKKYNIPLQIKTILMNVNKNEYKELRDFCKVNMFSYKVDPCIFPQSDGNLAPLKLRLSDSQLLEVMKDIDVINGYSSKRRDKNDYICSNIRHSLTIDDQGDVYPCINLFTKIGNIKENNIRKIWDSSKLLRDIQDATWGDLEDCFKCSKKDQCVRCAGIALLEDGNIFGKSSIACSVANARCKVY